MRRFVQTMRLAAVLLSVAVLNAACVSDRGAGAGAVTGSCILLDTDMGLDDIRAIGALLGRTQVVGVVTTEGVASPAPAAMAVSYLLAASGRAAPVVVGATTASPSQESWLPPVRANAERLNDFTATAVAAVASGSVEATVERWTQGCTEVKALVLGPWSSFVRYAPGIKAKLKQVVTQGKPLEELAAGQSPGFNCRYDIAACRAAHELLRPMGIGTWVDVPRDPQRPYAPTAEMIEALAPAGLPGLVRASMLTNRDRWKDTLMTDEAAVLYFLSPESYAVKDRHMEPTAAPEAFRQLWLRAANGR
jgi:hypothetical protein